MKIKIIPIIGLVIISYSLSWAIDKPLIDLAYKKINEKMEEEEKDECKKLKNPYKKISCANKIRKEYRKKGKIRGTEEYCELNYIDLSFKELEKTFKKMRIQKKTARYSYDAMYDEDLQLGEVTKEDLQTELMWVESRLARMQKAKVDRMEKSLK